MNSITSTLCLSTQLSSITKSGYLLCVMEPQNIFWTFPMSTIDSINILHIFCRTLYTMSIVVSHIPSLFVHLLLRRLFYLPERLQSKSIICASKNWRQINRRIVILASRSTDKFLALSRSYFVLFYPVACQETVNSCRYLRGIQFVNQTSIHENHQGKRKERAKCSSGVSGSCVVEGGRETNGRGYRWDYCDRREKRASSKPSHRDYQRELWRRVVCE